MRRAPRQLAWLLVIALALAFLFLGAGFDFDYVIPKRLARLAAMLIGGVAIAWSSIVFQTLTGNRILTPVSYTHLDVYKRQTPHRSATMARGVTSPAAAPSACTCLLYTSIE